ncbi:aminoglycoside phosphotransferase family protein [Methylomonas rosea]|uniref:Aminoglycoside phosphotransferase family protein n=1 Tax=Methylomonas rosea TaxID=2952227 RepID=A0ABT1TV15_9GAMM|nr:aminoglycoside phosphotransferase family protein [Methylomonas sp. WSC-7]MCQ8118596.1 aminoglycoside phosphotransferase family protein [Methylomonas sp. WSC-7]
MSNPLDQFTPLLDAEWMAATLQRYLPECLAGDWQVTGCEIQHPRYKTYRLAENRERSFLSLVYHLQGRKLPSSIADQRILYARAYLGQRSHQAFAEAQASGKKAIHLAELGMVGWRFPDDPAMPWLAELMDSRRIPELGQQTVSSIEIVNYRPEIRCTARYRFAAENTEPERVVYGKTYADERGKTVHDQLSILQKQFQSNLGFVMPKALAYDLEHRTVWLEGLQGQMLTELDFATTLAENIPALVNALAVFHQLTPPSLPAITLPQHLLEWCKKAEKLSNAYPAIQPVLSVLLSELQQNRPEVDMLGLIHGDFHIDQLLVLPNGRLALFDYDELALGDPLQDLANFAADLYNYPYPVATIDQLVRQLFTAYSAAKQGQADPQRFAWHLRGQLLTRAYRTFIQQKSAAEQRIADFIALALRPWPLAG